MVFNSFAFLAFFCFVVGILWLLPGRFRNVFLLIASYVFYAIWDWRFLFLISSSIIIDFISGLRIESFGNSEDESSRRTKKQWLILSIVINLAILGFFKYYNFFIDSAGILLANFGIDSSYLHLNIFLPIGISFYTFKTLTYTIDVYFGRMKATRSLTDYALFVSFFSELIAGPIDRARNLLPQIVSQREFSTDRFIDGANLILRGFFKKVFVADNIAVITNGVFSAANPSSFDILIGAYAFAIQIYADFSGYTDIARGCGKWLGFDLMINFNYPYFSASPSDFWQRWHISLSTWLRDYIFSPLGGALRSLTTAYRNLAITMLIAGLWHGASWTFVVWGGYWGVLLIGHRITQPFMKKFGAPFRKILSRKFRLVIKALFTFHLVCLGWVVFRAESMTQAWSMIQGLFSIQGNVNFGPMALLAGFTLPLIIVEVLQIIAGRDDIWGIRWIPAPIKTIILAILFYLLAFYGMATESFIYAQF